jgi:hypothetical protein
MNAHAPILLAFAAAVAVLWVLARAVARMMGGAVGRSGAGASVADGPALREPVGDRLDYRPEALLVTAGERAAWHTIRKCMPAWAHAVCPKVRIEDFLSAGGDGRGDRWRLRGYVKSRHVDFLVVDERWLPRLVIEVGRCSGLASQVWRRLVGEAGRSVQISRRVGTVLRGRLRAALFDGRRKRRKGEG